MNRSILMLEPDEDDRYITQTFFDEHKFDVKVSFVSTAPEFFDHLKKSKVTSLPSLILFNYHAIPMNAMKLIEDLRSNSEYKHIPVVVLTGMTNNEIVRECYSAGASSVIQKPSQSKETDEKIVSFFRYWFQTVELPRR